VTTCRGCDAPLPPAAGPRPRVWCSDRCRKAASRTTTPVKLTGPGPNRQAVEQDIARLDGGVDAAIVEAARSLADQVDRLPSSAPLWSRYLEAIERLRTAADEDAEADEVAALLRQLSGGEP
jgi:hypothetical protein